MKKIALLLVFAMLFCCCFALSSCDDNDDDSDVCGICGGSGTVTSKFLGEGSGIQKGFDTYYRCAGCHGTGRD